EVHLETVPGVVHRGAVASTTAYGVPRPGPHVQGRSLRRAGHLVHGDLGDRVMVLGNVIGLGGPLGVHPALDAPEPAGPWCLAIEVVAGDIPPTAPVGDSPGLQPAGTRVAAGLAVGEGHRLSAQHGILDRGEGRLTGAHARLQTDDR